MYRSDRMGFWKISTNILMITIRYEGIGIPLFWELLDNKSGNSKAEDRIDLLGKCVKLLGKDRIAYVIGDREFIGNKWLNWLKINQISFCMRLPKHHLISLKNGETYSVEELVASKKERYYEKGIVDGIICNIFIRKLENEDYLFLIGSEYSKKLGAVYRYRWSIEVCFHALKSRGFDLESTHFKRGEKIKKLLVFVSIALALCVNLGIFLDKRELGIIFLSNGQNKHWVYWGKIGTQLNKRKYDKKHFQLFYVDYVSNQKRHPK